MLKASAMMRWDVKSKNEWTESKFHEIDSGREKREMERERPRCEGERGWIFHFDSCRTKSWTERACTHTHAVRTWERKRKLSRALFEMFTLFSLWSDLKIGGTRVDEHQDTHTCINESTHTRRRERKVESEWKRTYEFRNWFWRYKGGRDFSVAYVYKELELYVGTTIHQYAYIGFLKSLACWKSDRTLRTRMLTACL